MHQIDGAALQVVENGQPIGVVTQSSLLARLTPASSE
jgi:glycine betaine/proline transport system ATP-binding protein